MHGCARRRSSCARRMATPRALSAGTNTKWCAARMHTRALRPRKRHPPPARCHLAPTVRIGGTAEAAQHAKVSDGPATRDVGHRHRYGPHTARAAPAPVHTPPVYRTTSAALRHRHTPTPTASTPRLCLAGHRRGHDRAAQHALRPARRLVDLPAVQVAKGVLHARHGRDCRPGGHPVAQDCELNSS